MFSLIFPGWCRSTRSIRRVSRRWRTIVTLSPRLLAVTRVLPSGVTAYPVVDNKEIAAVTVVSERVWAAKHGHGHGSDSGQARRSIEHQRTGGSDGTPFSAGFLLTPNGCRKAESDQKKTKRRRAQFHRPAFLVLQKDSVLHASLPP